jgi:hypothetical protein
VIKPRDLHAALHIIDTSDAVEILIRGYRTSNRGRPANRNGLRLMLVGMYLSIWQNGTATLTGAITALSSLTIEEQQRIGYATLVEHEGVLRLQPTVTLTDLYNIELAVVRGLSYGPSREPNLDDDEVARRHSTVQQLCDAVMDASIVDRLTTVMAMDATGIWSWGIGPKKYGEAVEAQIDLNLGRADSDDLETRAEDRSVTAAEAAVSGEPDGGTEDIAADRGGRRVDLDAGWGVKTSKSGDPEVFFGYHEHTLVQVPGRNEAKDSVPKLIRRFELTAANCDIVDVSLRLLDRCDPPPQDLLVDAHYHYKSVERWKRELDGREIAQHHTLRQNEQGFTESDRLRWGAGWAHCPATPDELSDVPPPAPNATAEAKAEWRRLVRHRELYAMTQHTAPGVGGRHRVRCPALSGKVGCPLRAGTVATSVANGSPIIQNPPTTNDGEPLPTCCTAQTVTVTPPPKVYKLQQRHYFGSEAWEDMWRRRTYVEGSYGIRKNPALQNVRRGHFQVFGIVWVHIVMALVNASYNTHMTRNWYERQLRDQPASVADLEDHPLIVDPGVEIVGHVAVTAEQLAQLRGDAA